MKHPVDAHQQAVDTANDEVREMFGEDAVPCEPGTVAHVAWLQMYDVALAAINDGEEV